LPWGVTSAASQGEDQRWGETKELRGMAEVAAVTGRRTSLMEEEGNQGGAESEPNELLSIEHNSYREPKDNCMDCWVGAADQGKVSVTVVALPKSKLQ